MLSLRAEARAEAGPGRGRRGQAGACGWRRARGGPSHSCACTSACATCHAAGCIRGLPHLRPAALAGMPPLFCSIAPCKKAVLEFMKRHGLTYPIIDIDKTGEGPLPSLPLACLIKRARLIGGRCHGVASCRCPGLSSRRPRRRAAARPLAHSASPACALFQQAPTSPRAMTPMWTLAGTWPGMPPAVQTHKPAHLRSGRPGAAARVV